MVALALLESLVERGLDPGRARLFVLDGSKALHKAVGQVFGSACLVQRCRNRKMQRCHDLPKELHDQASAVLRAAWKLAARRTKARIESVRVLGGGSIRTQREACEPERCSPSRSD